MVSYLNDAWTPTSGCNACTKNRIDVSDAKELPTLLMTLMIEETTPFLYHWFDRLDALTYPKDKLDVLVHNQVRKNVFLISFSYLNDFIVAGYKLYRFILVNKVAQVLQSSFTRGNVIVYW